MSNVSDPDDLEAVDDTSIEPLPDDIEVPVADALDQRRPLSPTAEEPLEIPDTVNEADALDQARVVALPDEEDQRDPM